MHLPVGLDLEDLSPKQLRMLLRRASMAQLPAAKRSKIADEDEDCDDGACEENEDKVSLNEEKKGKAQSPPVVKDDLPKGVTMPEGDGGGKKRRA